MNEDDNLEDATHSIVEPGPNTWWSLILRGLVFPLGVFSYAIFCWLTERAYLPGRNGGAELYGFSARWMALAVVAVAVFCHARWWWGAKGFHRAHEALMILSCLLFIVSFFSAVVCGLGGV